jgi:hypothetical protein
LPSQVVPASIIRETGRNALSIASRAPTSISPLKLSVIPLLEFSCLRPHVPGDHQVIPPNPKGAAGVNA